MASHLRRLLQSASWLTLGSVSSKLLLLGAESLFASRRLADFGTLALLLTTVEVVVALSNAGLADSHMQLTRENASADDASADSRSGSLLSSTLGLGIVASSAIAALGLVIIEFAGISDRVSSLVVYFLALVPLGCIRRLLATHLLAVGQPLASSIVGEGLRNLIFFCVVLGVPNIELSTLVISFLLSDVLAITAGLLMSGGLQLPRRASLRALIRFALTVAPVLSLQFATQAATIPAAGLVLELEEVAVVALGFRWALALQLPQTVINQAIAPLLAGLSNDLPAAENLIQRVSLLVLGVGTAMTLVFGPLVSLAVPFFDLDYRTVLPTFLLLGAAAGLATASGPLAQAFVNLRKHHELFLSWLFSGPPRIVLLIVCGSIGGATGIAAAVLISEVIQWGVRLTLMYSAKIRPYGVAYKSALLPAVFICIASTLLTFFYGFTGGAIGLAVGLLVVLGVASTWMRGSFPRPPAI